MLKVLLDKIRIYSDKTFLIENDIAYTYRDLLSSINDWQEHLKSIKPGSRVVHSGGYTLNNISLLIALAVRDCLAIPVSSSDLSIPEITEICSANYFIDNWCAGDVVIECINPEISQILPGAGIIFFTSGSSGKPKAAVHDFSQLLSKYKKARKAFRTCSVLLFDHLAGFDNLFYILFAGGSLIVPQTFSPDQVLKTISRYKVQILSATPSFLNFVLMENAELKQNLSGLEIIVFSSEKMAEITLTKLKTILPANIKLIQKYGSTEMGSPSSRTNPDNPLWLKFDPDQIEYKIIDSILYLKSTSSFRGYLNYESETDNDWYCTGDMVETEEEWLHIIGRKSDLINVGGRKVLPQEVEEVLQAMDIVLDATVSAKTHPLMGQVVKAVISLQEGADRKEFISDMRIFCKDKLTQYKIPVYVEFQDQIESGNRMKKIRK
jgi:long-chain acyl-CoA synthetase